MIGASPLIAALKASLTEPIDVRLLRIKKAIAAAEQREVKITDRLCRAIVQTLNSVKWSPEITADQTALVVDYRTRVDAFDPRNPENRLKSERPLTEREKYLQELKEREPAKPHIPSDGFRKGFLDSSEVIARVSVKYPTRPAWTNLESEKLLQVALGDVVLNADSVNQLFLCLAYRFKERLIASGLPATLDGDDLPGEQAKWVLAAICSHANRYAIAIPPPGCLNFIEELAFRA